MTITSLIALLLLTQPGQSEPPPKLEARLFASRAAVQPGESVELAIQLDLTPRWHIYHPIIVDTGAPTVITLELPEGVSASPLLFPAPELASAFEQEYLGHEGRIVVLTTLSADESLAPGTELKLKASVDALACIELCIPVTAAAELTLPVSESPGAAQHEKLFEEARAKLPPRLAEGPYLKGSSVRVEPSRIPVGGSGELIATIRVEEGHHIQDRDPGLDALIASRLFIESVDGIEFGDQVWPKPKERDFAGLGRVREQSGEFQLRVPLKVIDEQFEPRSVRLRTLFQYQACTDAGQCYPPELAEGFVEFTVAPADGAAPPVAADSADDGAQAGAAAGRDGSSAAPPRKSPSSLILVFLGAFAGGAILNIMPCVLPVISLKIFSFMQQAHEDPQRVFLMGLVYALGVLASFAVLAAVMLSASLAWGGLMQSPTYVTALIGVVFAFGLSMLGVFELRLPGVVESAAGSVTTREGFGGAFLNGLMATALATPCVGPFLGPAVGVLVQLPTAVGAAGIMTVGLGLAAPYVLLAAFPGWLKFVPKPGRWMITVKQFMGFVLMGTVVWLYWILQYQVSSGHLVATMAFLLLVGLACWVVGQIKLSDDSVRVFGRWAVAAVLVAIAWTAPFRLLAEPLGEAAGSSGGQVNVVADSGEEGWIPWEPGLPERLAAEGKTVYVDFTAKWCVTCQANKRLVLTVDPVASRLKEMNVVKVIADFTRRNPDIQNELRRFDRAGVPLNIIYPAGRPEDVIVLPEILRAGIVLDALEKAGPSKPGRDVAAAGSVRADGVASHP